MDNVWRKSKPYLAVIFLQFGLAGMAIIAKFALNKGLNHYIFVVYRHAVATIVIAPFALVFERKVRPKMTVSTFGKILLLALLEPVVDQNLYFSGMKYTTATFVTAMSNMLPAMTFLLAWIFRLENVNIRRIHSQAKIIGTMVTVGGAMVMTLVKGPVLKLPWTEATTAAAASSSSSSSIGGTLAQQDPIKGALLVSSGCVCWACFMILQAVTLKTYPAELSLTALICLAGTLEGGLLALITEGRNPAVWAIHFDSRLLAAVYSGVLCSGVAYYVQGVIMKERGPVFVTAFNPLSMVIVAIFGSFVLSELLSLGRIVGAAVIVMGLYVVIWGKSKDLNNSSSDSSLTNNKTDQQILPMESFKSGIAIDVESKTEEESGISFHESSGVNKVVTAV